MGSTSESKDVFASVKTGYVFKAKKRNGIEGKRYKTIEKIGEGGMGAVYLVENEESKTQSAIKCEKYKEEHGIMQRRGLLRLAMEKLIMKTCRDSEHFPKYIDLGSTKKFGWIAMTLVGPSLNDLKHKAAARKFSVNTCLKIGLQVAKGLKDLHAKGFVHRDLKPENLAVGLHDNSKKIIILDLGIARQYKNVEGINYRPREYVRFKGTRSFAPLCMHRNQEYGPKDDLESLFYTLAILQVGKLPWTNITNVNEVAKCKQKHRYDPAAIFDRTGLSQLLAPLWTQTVLKLKHNDEIDYEYVIKYLNTALEDLGAVNQPFDWEKQEG